MILIITRKPAEGDALRGELKIDGKPFCLTLENTNKAIPEMWYPVSVTMSPKFHRLLPIVNQVPSRSGIRFHRGTKPEHSSGCILVPPEKEKELTNLLLTAQNRHEDIRLEITHWEPAYSAYSSAERKHK